MRGLHLWQTYNPPIFCTETIKDDCREHGIVMKATTPYAHASNGVVEQSNRTIIQGVRCALSDSDLPPSLWANATHYQVNTQNLIPSSRHPDSVPAEKWTWEQQNVLHL